jgi:predicted acetyltransferase
LKHEEYGPSRDDAERALFGEILARSFAIPRTECPAIIDRAGRANVRVVREDGRAIGGLILVPMGQWFGGKRVPMTGLAAVGIDPFARGRGAAKRLLVSMLHELSAQGVALSTLYPSTQSLYRSVGYEQAGQRFEIRARCGDLASSAHLGGERAARKSDVAHANVARTHADAAHSHADASRSHTDASRSHADAPRSNADASRSHADASRSLALVRLDRGDDPRIHAAYREVAQRSPGWLDRNEYMWGRVPEWRGETRDGYAVLDGHDIAGYLFLAPRRLDSGRHDLFLSDFVAHDAHAARRLFAFLAGHRSLADDVVWFGGANDALLAVLPEMSYRARLLYNWMVRIVDVRAALEQRGYSASVEVELHLEVSDDVLTANNARFILHLENGRASVKPGGKGRIELDVRALASLYTGFLSAEALAATGRLKAEKNDLARATAVFAGQTPSMPDMF